MEIYDRIIIKLKVIAYKIDITCCLFFLPSGLAIESSH